MQPAYSLLSKSSLNVDVENVVNLPVIGLPSSNFLSILWAIFEDIAPLGFDDFFK